MRKPNKKNLKPKPKDKSKLRQKQKQTVNVKVHIDQSKRTVQRKPKESTLPSKQNSESNSRRLASDSDRILASGPFYHMPPPVIYQPPPQPQQIQQQPSQIQEGYHLGRIDRLLTEARQNNYPLLPPAGQRTPNQTTPYGLNPVSNTSTSLGDSIAKQETANRLETIYEQQDTPIKNSLLNPVFKNQLFKGNPLAQAVEKETQINRLNPDVEIKPRKKVPQLIEDEKEATIQPPESITQASEPYQLEDIDESTNVEWVDIDEGETAQPSKLKMMEDVDEGKSPVKIEKEKYQRKKKADFQLIAIGLKIDLWKPNGKEKTIEELKTEIAGKTSGKKTQMKTRARSVKVQK